MRKSNWFQVLILWIVVYFILLILWSELFLKDKHSNIREEVVKIPTEKTAFVTFIPNNEYVLGASVLAETLSEWKCLDENVKLILLFTSKADSPSLRQMSDLNPFLEFHLIEESELSKLLGKIPQSDRETSPSSWLKFVIWGLEYDTLIYMEPHTLVLDNLNELFNIPKAYPIAASYDCCDRFNADVLVIHSSSVIYAKMKEQLEERVQSGRLSYDGSFQGFLNEVFEENWGQLAFQYNAQQKTFLQNHRSWKVGRIKVLNYNLYHPWNPTPKFLSNEEEEVLKTLKDAWNSIRYAPEVSDLIDN